MIHKLLCIYYNTDYLEIISIRELNIRNFILINIFITVVKTLHPMVNEQIKTK